ncbi:hypothetical protein [Mucilaginibacter antarcticus]|uniref:Uncharacterized protein n=1 Tax=Mucilaginibacter antarcticus TaxID=1855725 RepID=A0ABW5XPN3_9SPHI
MLKQEFLTKIPTERPLTGLVTLYLDYTIVDRNGSYLDYRSFLLEDTWYRQQMGDRLPFSYQPPHEPDVYDFRYQ